MATKPTSTSEFIDGQIDKHLIAQTKEENGALKLKTNVGKDCLIANTDLFQTTFHLPITGPARVLQTKFSRAL